MVVSPLQSPSLREKEDKGKNSHKACPSTLSYGRSLPIYGHLVSRFFIKILIIMFICTNIHRSYVWDPLGLYISLANKSIDLITPDW